MGNWSILLLIESVILVTLTDSGLYVYVPINGKLF